MHEYAVFSHCCCCWFVSGIGSVTLACQLRVLACDMSEVNISNVKQLIAIARVRQGLETIVLWHIRQLTADKWTVRSSLFQMFTHCKHKTMFHSRTLQISPHRSSTSFVFAFQLAVNLPNKSDALFFFFRCVYIFIFGHFIKLHKWKFFSRITSHSVNSWHGFNYSFSLSYRVFRAWVEKNNSKSHVYVVF